ncbi:MAG TPA: hypothetical protein VH500_01520 [Nitrososphaeraceae archaeon]
MGVVLWLILSLRGKLRFLIPIIYASIYLLGVLANNATLVEITIVFSIPLVISLSVYNRVSNTKVLKNHHNLYVNYSSILVTVLSCTSIIISLAIPLMMIPPRSIPIPNYVYAIYAILGSMISPIFMILLINAAPIKILVLECEKSISKLKRKTIKPLFISRVKISQRNTFVFLSLIVLLTLFFVLVPHLHTFNKTNRLVGADTADYVSWEKLLMQSRSPQDFLSKAFMTLEGGDRPITLIFLYAIIKLVHANPLSTVDYIPMILGPILVIAIYFLTREITENDTISIFASFLTAVSFHVLVGIYAGYYANWFALIIGYMAFVFLFRFLKGIKKINLIVYFLLITLVLFTHTYTWTILTIVTIIFLLSMLGLGRYSKKGIIFLLIIISLSIIVDIAKIALTRSAGGIEQDISIARSQEVGVGQLPIRWNNLIDTTEIYYAGAFSNVIILALGLYWLVRSDVHETTNIFIIVFLAIGILPLFLGNWLIQSRVFYNIPFQIPAAVGLFYIKREKNGLMIIISLSILLIAIAVRNLSFLGT